MNIEIRKVCKCSYTTSEAVRHILLPGFDSKLSSLETYNDDDNDYTIEENINCC